MKKAITAGLALLAAVALLAGCGGAGGGSTGESADGLTTVRIGSEKVTSDAGIFLADHLGYFEKEGIKVEYVRLKDAPAITNALATGNLEVAGASLAPGVFSALNRDIKIRVVGDKQSIRPGVSATRFAVKPEYDKGSIEQTLEGLRGKKVAVHSNLSIQVFMLSNLLERHGMSLDDFQITPVHAPDQVSAFRGGSIDAAVMLEPYMTQGTEAGIAKLAADLTEGAPEDGETLTGLLYGKTMLENRKLGDAFMRAYMRGVRAYNNAIFHGKNHDQVVGIIAEEADMPAELIEKTKPVGLDPDQRLDADYLGRLQDFYVHQGILDHPVDVRKLIDTSFAEAAVEQLGKYRAP
ncbi:ABC transporter substrate-binding protein [Qaidamihabitans albus]|uniref:ABC transporter substrate-binding protein n=1 Tax=Qaidamihabitans albus TaxID=2795733 RepID=UPI0018F1B086|nr:ABC transporter substrate-binding protein [Qaidamihabitans albus]